MHWKKQSGLTTIRPVIMVIMGRTVRMASMVMTAIRVRAMVPERAQRRARARRRGWPPKKRPARSSGPMLMRSPGWCVPDQGRMRRPRAVTLRAYWLWAWMCSRNSPDAAGPCRPIRFWVSSRVAVALRCIGRIARASHCWSNGSRSACLKRPGIRATLRRSGAFRLICYCAQMIGRACCAMYRTYWLVTGSM